MKFTYVPTPFYQTLLEPVNPTRFNRNKAYNCTRFPQKNYKPYQLFALRTRLQPLINKHFGLKSNGDARYIVRFNQKRLNNRLVVVVNLHSGEITDIPDDDIVQLTESDYNYVKSAIDWITGIEPDLSLLISNDTIFMSNTFNISNQEFISNCWSRSIISFLSFSSHIRPHMRDPKNYQVGGLYVDLSHMVNFKQAYDDIYLDSVKRINQMYESGFISLPTSFDSGRLINWGTYPIGLNKSIDINEEYDLSRKVLFRPRWTDKRLTDPVGGVVAFLQKHIGRGSDQVLLNIGGSDPITRHKVAKTFQGFISVIKYKFIGDMVEVEANDLNTAQKLATLVERSKTMPVGRLITIYGSDPRQFNTYLARFPSSNSSLKIDMLGYRTDDSRDNYCISCKIPYESDPDFYYNALTNWYNRNVNQIEVPPLIAPYVAIKSPEAVEIPSQIPKIRIKKPGPIVKEIMQPIYFDIEKPRAKPSIMLPKLHEFLPQLKPSISTILSSVGIPATAIVA